MSNIGNNLKKARLLSNLSLREAGRILNISATAVNKYEKGEIIPDSKRLIDFANAYNVKANYLIKSYDIPKLSFSSFRKKKKLSGQKFEVLKNTIEEEVGKNFEILDIMGIIDDYNVNLPKYDCKSLDDVEESSSRFRKDVIGISSKLPIYDLIGMLESIGIIIVSINDEKNLFDGFDGFCEIVNDIPVIVIPLDIKDGARQRFTLAHELGHLVLNVIDKEQEESFCNRFASSLLMPKDVMVKEFGLHRNNISLYELDSFKNEYKVSYSAILYRLKDLNIISDYLYRKFTIIINQMIGKNDPNPITPEKTYQFEKNVLKLRLNDIISREKASELLGDKFFEIENEDNYY